MLQNSCTFSSEADKLSITSGPPLTLLQRRGQVSQQLIHHAQYQLISKHKQSISDIRDSWISGGTGGEMHLCRIVQLLSAALSLPRLAWFSCVPRFLQLFYFRSTTLPEPIAPWHCGVDSIDSFRSSVPGQPLTRSTALSCTWETAKHAKQSMLLIARRGKRTYHSDRRKTHSGTLCMHESSSL